MACRVPGCSTKYWDATNKRTLFKAPSLKQLTDWQEILSRKGVNDFGTNDLVCILHFKEDCIERERVIYKSGGIISKQPRKILLLTYTAVPTMFPTKTLTTARKRRSKPETDLKYVVTLDSEIFRKHRENLKRKLSSEDVGRSLDVDGVEQMKTNNLFQSVVNSIRNHERLSPHLNSLWTANVCDDDYVRWSLWKTDRSGEETSITLNEDLQVEVFVNGRKIALPEIHAITQMCDLQDLFRQVSQIFPCKQSHYESRESQNACLGFVMKNIGRQRVRCAPCCRDYINWKRRIGPQAETPV